MSPSRFWFDILAAVQFLTRIPVSSSPYDAGSLSRAVKFFPVVGLLVGGCAVLLEKALAPHLPALATSLFVVVFLVCITGCLHEDGLADAVDGFGGGWTREQTLAIFKDSRIGSYGAAALCLSLVARVLLIGALPATHMAAYLTSAHVLCRWTTIPLSYCLPPARVDADQASAGQGARIARLTTRGTLIGATVFSFGFALLVLRTPGIAVIAVAILTTWATALFYRRRIDGVTGDCFGATNQLTEIAVYLCGVWIA